MAPKSSRPSPRAGRGRREPGGNLQWQAGVHDRQQLGSQRLQVELLAKPPLNAAMVVAAS
jgi:hypothetical protein